MNGSAWERLQLAVEYDEDTGQPASVYYVDETDHRHASSELLLTETLEQLIKYHMGYLRNNLGMVYPVRCPAVFPGTDVRCVLTADQHHPDDPWDNHVFRWPSDRGRK